MVPVGAVTYRTLINSLPYLKQGVGFGPCCRIRNPGLENLLKQVPTGIVQDFLNLLNFTGRHLSMYVGTSVADPDSFYTDPDTGIFFQSGSRIWIQAKKQQIL